MGGAGSSRWGSYIPAAIVENTEVLRLGKTNPRRKRTASEDAKWDAILANGLRLGYRGSHGQGEPREVTVRVVFTRPHLGGRRYWLACPRCERRCLSVYLRKGNLACRVCHRLSYESSRESRVFDGFSRRVAGDIGFGTSEVRQWLRRRLRKSRLCARRARAMPLRPAEPP